MSYLAGPAFLDETGKVPAAALPAPAGGNLSACWPIGSIFFSAVSTNPATLLGFGTWVAFGAGKFPVGFDSNQTEFDADGETGGAKTFTPAGTVSAPTFTGSSASTSSNSAGTPAGTNSAPAFTGSSAATSSDSAGTPAGTNSAPTFTGSALATHQHELPFIKANSGTGTLSMLAPTVFGTGTSRAPISVSAAPTANTTSAAVELSEAKSAGTPAGTVSAPTFTGNALQAHSHTVTATGTVAAPTFTGSALAGHSHTVTAAGTNSAPTFTGSAGTSLPPYITLRMWQRTA
jgi:hypothetical protein